MTKITIIGSSNTDMVIKSGHLPSPGETVLGGDFFMNPGGKGANQAVAAARLGGEVHFVCKVGKDVFGETALQQFKNEGIHTRFVTQDPFAPSGVALINVDAKGENCITVASGANNCLSKADIDAASDIFEAGDFVLMQLETPIETVVYSAEKAAKKGLKVVLNPAPATDLPGELFPHLYAITPNETEAEILTSVAVIDLLSAEKAANILLNKGVQHVIITLGAEGALYKTAYETQHVPVAKVVAQDTTAAGDCFNGALVVGLSEGMDFPEAIKFACKAASISVTRLGAQASMPKLQEL
ncbi:ribokinase [Aquirufa sp.]|jgi:ribokinase|uniref:ribokinase n=1 Tax=Aquirufa sp. TaxID=2676249 RepID=UPI0037842BF5